MITTIAKKEFTEMLRDGRFRWSAGVTLLLLFAALLTGWQYYRKVHAEHEAAQKASRAQWVNQGARNPHSAAHYGVYAFKPVSPLAFVDRGLDPFTGISIWLEAHYQNPSRYRPAEDATAMQRLGELTAAGILQLLLPLLIILLAFAAFAGEVEHGTLRQLLSLGVPRPKILLGKFGGVALALAVLLVPATLLGVLALSLGSANALLAGSAPRMLLLAAGYLIYFGVFIAVALAISASARSSRAALLALLAFWIVNSLLVPRLAADAAERLHPAPNAKIFWEAVSKNLKEGIDGHNTRDQRVEKLKQQVLAQYQVARVEDLPVNFSGISLQAGEEYGNQVFDKHVGELWETYARQENVHSFAALAAPFMALRAWSMGLSGTDLGQHRHFVTAAENYRRALNKMMNEDLTYNSKIQGYNYFAQRDLWEKSPDFVYAAPALGWVLREQSWSAAALLCWLLLAAAAAFFAARRMKV